MKLIKLGIISIIAFSILLWLFTLIFPASTVLSRVRNLPGTSTDLKQQLLQDRPDMKDWLLPTDAAALQILKGSKPYYKWQLYNAMPQPNADTLYFQIKEDDRRVLNGGLGLYQLSPDSVTTQLFLVFETPWYNPVKKLGMMLVDKQYGPIMEDALQRLYEQYSVSPEAPVPTPEN